MSGPRMGNVGQMNGSRRPNISRMNYHESRQPSAYQDHRQSYQDHRQSVHEGRPHERPHDARQHDHRAHDNRSNEGRQTVSHQMPPSAMHTQHDELIKYIYDSWSKIEMDKGSNNVMYYQEHENLHLKDFRPFNLEAYWGRRIHQSHHQQHMS